MNRIAALLLLVSAPSLACDWQVKQTVDPMTDVATCWVSSPSAAIAFYRHGADRPNVRDSSIYSRSHLKIRIDDNAAISMGDDAGTRGRAMPVLLSQLQTGQRIRVSFSNYPDNGAGDAPICNLPELLATCGQ